MVNGGGCWAVRCHSMAIIERLSNGLVLAPTFMTWLRRAEKLLLWKELVG